MTPLQKLLMLLGLLILSSNAQAFEITVDDWQQPSETTYLQYTDPSGEYVSAWDWGMGAQLAPDQMLQMMMDGLGTTNGNVSVSRYGSTGVKFNVNGSGSVRFSGSGSNGLGTSPWSRSTTCSGGVCKQAAPKNASEIDWISDLVLKMEYATRGILGMLAVGAIMLAITGVYETIRKIHAMTYHYTYYGPLERGWSHWKTYEAFQKLKKHQRKRENSYKRYVRGRENRERYNREHAGEPTQGRRPKETAQIDFGKSILEEMDATEDRRTRQEREQKEQDDRVAKATERWNQAKAEERRRKKEELADERRAAQAD